MSNTKELITVLDSKVTILLEKVKSCSAALQSKTREAESLRKQLTETERQIAQLRTENEELRIASPIENVLQPAGESSEETQARISELVKEIDTCISLLKV